jgi:hypothetical protein
MQTIFKRLGEMFSAQDMSRIHRDRISQDLVDALYNYIQNDRMKYTNIALPDHDSLVKAYRWFTKNRHKYLDRVDLADRDEKHYVVLFKNRIHIIAQ